MGILTDDMQRVVREQRLAFVATVCPDGTPNLFLNREGANAENDVEASFPWSDIVELLAKIQDDISHHVFFPRLRASGYSPDQPWLTELQKLRPAEWREKDDHYLLKWSSGRTWRSLIRT